MLPMILKGWVDLPVVAPELVTCATNLDRGTILHKHFGANLVSLHTLLGEPSAGLFGELAQLFTEVRGYLESAGCTIILHQLCFTPQVSLTELLAINEQLCILMVAAEFCNRLAKRLRTRTASLNRNFGF
jgi:hypothetical protein